MRSWFQKVVKVNWRFQILKRVTFTIAGKRVPWKLVMMMMMKMMQDLQDPVHGLCQEVEAR
jgi:hypothetical protein